jgi:hypothetical protein
VIAWQRLSGEEVERLVATLIAKRHPRAHRITPSSGDRGMDIVDRLDDGRLVVYQVKRYTGPLTARQVREVESSLQALLTHAGTTGSVGVWHLVMPWSPTPERLAWLRELEMRIAPIELRWDDVARLDAWAAEHQDVLDFLLPGRPASRDAILTEVLHSRLPDPDEDAPADLLAAAQSHGRVIQHALDRVDPYYRYEVRHFTGPQARAQAEAAAPGDDVVAVRIITLEDGDARWVAIYPKTAMSTALSPLVFNATFAVTDEHRAAVQSFREYGTPLVGLPASVEFVSGPPGFVGVPRTFLIDMTPADEEVDLPDTEFALFDADGDLAAVVELGPLRRTRGLDGQGIRLAGPVVRRRVRVRDDHAACGRRRPRHRADHVRAVAADRADSRGRVADRTHHLVVPGRGDEGLAGGPRGARDPAD